MDRYQDRRLSNRDDDDDYDDINDDKAIDYWTKSVIHSTFKNTILVNASFIQALLIDEPHPNHAFESPWGKSRKLLVAVLHQARPATWGQCLSTSLLVWVLEMSFLSVWLICEYWIYIFHDIK